MNTMRHTTPPTQEEVTLARQSQSALRRCASNNSSLCRLKVMGDGEQVVEVPKQAIRLLMDILDQMSRGNAVTVIPIHAELTTQEAADLLNVSRPLLVGLMKRGAIPFHKVGTHRRVRFEDLVAFKAQVEREQQAAMDELAQQAQELGMGYN